MNIDWFEVKVWAVIISICVIILGLVILVALGMEKERFNEEIFCNSFEGEYDLETLFRGSCLIQINESYYRYEIEEINGRLEFIK